MLELHKLKRASHLVAFAIIFIFFHERGWQGAVFKIIKNDHFLMFLAVCVLFCKFLGRLRIELHDKSATCSCLLISFAIREERSD